MPSASSGRVLFYPDSLISPSALPRGRATGGFSTVQALMAMAIVMIAGLASVEALVLTNHKAAAMRTVNNARAVVQRNIDAALGVPFSANEAAPPILAIGSGPYDDDGDGVFTVPIVVARNGTDRVVSGTLTRTVTAETNPEGANIRRITFQVGYTYRSRPYTFAMTTLRSTD